MPGPMHVKLSIGRRPKPRLEAAGAIMARLCGLSHGLVVAPDERRAATGAPSGSWPANCTPQWAVSAFCATRSSPR